MVIGSIYGSADGMVRVQDKAHRGQFYGKVLQPIHTEIGKGDVFIYDYDDLYSGDGRIDSEWPALKTAFERYLDEKNFDNEGRPVTSLSSLTTPLLHKKDV